MSLAPPPVVTKNIQHINEMIDDMGADLVYNMKDQLKAEDKVWTGAARDSIQYDKNKQLVFSDLIYVYNIEFGRKKGAPPPPFSKIHDWVKSKLKMQDPDAYWAAHNIRYHIKKEGIDATRFTKKAIIAMTNPSGMPLISHKKRTTKLTYRQKQLRTKLAADQRIKRSFQKQNRIQMKQFHANVSRKKKRIAAHKKRVKNIKNKFHTARKTSNRFKGMKSFVSSKSKRKRGWGKF